MEGILVSVLNLLTEQIKEVVELENNINYCSRVKYNVHCEITYFT